MEGERGGGCGWGQVFARVGGQRDLREVCSLELRVCGGRYGALAVREREYVFLTHFLSCLSVLVGWNIGCGGGEGVRVIVLPLHM